MKNINRRDFLKVAMTLSAGSLLSTMPALGSLKAQSDKPNIIILVLDAMSARNLSVYGYPRNTTPGLERIAERAIVYHSHYSAGNFTTSGTSSMLTGLYPWTHRGINLSGLVNQKFVEHNIFNFLKDEYYCAAFSQNYLADVLLDQFQPGIDRHIVASSFFEQVDRPLLGQYFPRDPVAAYFGLDDYLFSGGISREGSIPSAPIFGFLNKFAHRDQNFYRSTPDYPYGMPYNSSYSYDNGVAFAGLLAEISNLASEQSPFLSYFHMYSPHEPYAPLKEFVDIFPEMEFLFKKPTKFSTLDIPHETIVARRKRYDEYVANIDFEIEKLVNALEDSGILENSYLVITADHGELFERGEHGHVTRLLYDAVVHIPLLILAPGQKTRRDVYHRTSNIDLLPTFLKIAGREPSVSLEGKVLPGLGGGEEVRSIYSMEAKGCSSFGNLKNGVTLSMIKGDRKLIYYTGYPKHQDTFELYNLNNDVEEMNDLYQMDTVTASKMKGELLANFEANRAIV
jgi:arylsulfatase A-like enzyme